MDGTVMCMSLQAKGNHPTVKLYKIKKNGILKNNHIFIRQ